MRILSFLSTSLLVITLNAQKLPQYVNGKEAYKQILNEEIQFPQVNLKTLECGYISTIFHVDVNGEIDSVFYRNTGLNNAFDEKVQAFASKIEKFNSFKGKNGKASSYFVFQPVGFLFSDKVCPSWNKLSSDSNWVHKDSVFYYPEHNIYRDSRNISNIIFRDKGLELVNDGKYKEAISYFEEGMAFEPENDFYPYNLGICYYHIRKIDKACEYLKTAKKMGNKYAKSVYKEKCNF
ncbi:tetratricopeptide repeat protein [Luteibaculum oceani]|uniref:Uncharacterized protein n=1 Tax=Luteibaculum oceani TaxID=1294296 RepID=A0A5C6UUE4_9FLAO|nr:hypothetical protein [Luteibaculum oceani]TXC76214.1 hypothetical protein FRX97_10730 [Luteibaculum oceani]